MTQTSTPIHPKKSSKKEAAEQLLEPEENFYKALKPKLDELYKEPSEETITKILAYAKKR
ncbi:hypothetical protein [Nubsella zeaxanthinifaciens]|uniref:hypothetical protein n=1 Tax=Nubsella zeaxanthinifaciens TaxID=392412 RepID=UPI000DE2C205|nr:hypothetical protein [Nubsella zeaxanthinifaciens]